MQLSPAELADNALSPETLDLAVCHFKTSGYVLFTGVLPPDLITAMHAGSLLIRDLRMWHRGTPNRSDEIRPNMAMIYAQRWLKTHYPPVGIPQATYEGLSPRTQQLFRYEDIGGTLAHASS